MFVPLFYKQASTYRPRYTYYVTVLVFVCPYVRTTLALFIALTEHIIEGFNTHHSKVVHVKALSGHFVGEINGQNVVISSKIRGTQQLIYIFRLSSHGWVLVSFNKNLSSVGNYSKGDMEVICSEVIC